MIKVRDSLYIIPIQPPPIRADHLAAHYRIARALDLTLPLKRTNQLGLEIHYSGNERGVPKSSAMKNVNPVRKSSEDFADGFAEVVQSRRRDPLESFPLIQLGHRDGTWSWRRRKTAENNPGPFL